MFGVSGLSVDEAIMVLRKTFRLLMLVLVFVLVASFFLAMLLGLELFFFTTEGHVLSSRADPLPILLFLLVFVETPFVVNWGLIFFFVWIIYLFCFFAAWMWRERFHKVVGTALLRSEDQLLNSFLFTLPILASMLLLVVIALQLFQESAGIPTGEPLLPSNPFETFFLLAYSPFIEEVGFRLSPMGLFLIPHVLMMGKNIGARLSLKRLFRLLFVTFVYPDEAKRIVGLKNVGADGFGGVSVGEWVMLLFTSFVFGLFHLLSGMGWDVGKVTSTFLVGFVFGLAYLAYGFQAPLLLHWYFNYYFYTFELASDLYPSVFSIKILVLFLNAVMGVLGLLAFLIMGLKRLFKKLMKRESETSILLF